MISYAQTLEDVMLNRVFCDRSDGFYVDVGAADPVDLSVTKWFYDLGWSGINIEPHPDYFQKLTADRPRDTNLDCAAGAEKSLAEFYELSDKAWSTLDVSLQRAAGPNIALVGIRSVQILSLNDILDHYAGGRHIDFLKIDVEGWEYNVLKGLDLRRYRPTIILLEAVDRNTHTIISADSNRLLLNSGYLRVYFDGLNEFFVAEEQRHLATHFATPPNVFDNFELYRVKELAENVQRLLFLLKESENELKESESDRAAQLDKRNVLRWRIQNITPPSTISSLTERGGFLSSLWNGLQRTGVFGGRIRHKAQEAKQSAKQVKQSLLPEVPNGILIQLAYEEFLHRGAQANEIVSWDHFLGQSLLQREVFFNELVLTCRRSMINRAVHGAGQENDPTRFLILGSDITFTIEDWRKREGKIKDRTKAVVPKQKSYARFSLVSEPEVLVTAIASLYKGGRYISNFMENITSQSIFRDYCELVIVDASSPENEFEVIQPYLGRFPNIKYFRTQNRIGIYEAWNLAISKSQGKFITNTNLDDLRRTDSFELQTSTLENVSFADVVYQDFLYSIDASLTFDEVSSFDVVSNLPVVCRNNLLSFNSPHNAPMWRRSLHNEVGLFDTTYRSAGDWEFWLRCAIAGKQFYKINDPHVVSFANPEGVSTRPDARGLEESYQITRALARKVLSEHLVCDPERFLEEVCRRSGQNFAMSKEDSASEDWRYLAVQRALRQVSAA